MVVLIANHLPAAVRGRLKLWFLEPRPNVFVSSIKDSVADKVIEELWGLCPPSSGLMVINSCRSTQGFRVGTRGEPLKSVLRDLDFSLIIDKTIV